MTPTLPVSSVDPTLEIEAIETRLATLVRIVTDPSGDLHYGKTYDGVVPGVTKLELDGFGKKIEYRDFEPGSVIPAAQGRMLAANEQQQPHVWAFQIHHFGSTRKKSRALAIETDRSLLGWAPTPNCGPISTFYFTMYDETAKNGEHVGWVTTRFYEATLGVSPDFSLVIAD